MTPEGELDEDALDDWAATLADLVWPQIEACKAHLTEQ